MSVVVESRLESVPLAGILVRTFCLESGASEVASGQIEVCVVEAANNCVVHAYKKESCHTVEVIVSRHDSDFCFEVWDQGMPMKAGALQHDRGHLLELDPQELSGARESGRGLAIMEAVMDTLEYATVDGRNRLSMTKRIAVAAAKT